MATHQSMKKKEKKRSNFKGLKKTVTSSSAGRQSTCIAGDAGSIPGSGRSPGEGSGYPLQYPGVSLVAQLVKNPPAMQETWVRSLGWEDPLGKGMATHSSILDWRIPGSQRVRRDWVAFTFTFNHLTDLHQHHAIKASRNGDWAIKRPRWVHLRTVTRKREVRGTGQWVWEDWKVRFKNLSCLWLREAVWYFL